MWVVSPETKVALSSSLRRGRVVFSAWRGGVRVKDIPQDVQSGSLSFTGGTGVRAQGEMAVALQRGLWDEFVPGVTVVRLTWVVRRVDGSTENIPLGTFDVVSRAISYGGGSGTLNLRLRDLFGRVIDRGFDHPSSPRGNPVKIAAAYIREAIGDSNLVAQHLTRTDVTVWGQVYEGSRADAVKKLLDAVGMEAFIRRDARLIIRPVPLLAGTTAESIRQGRNGSFVAGEREQSREDVVNRLVVRPEGARVWFQPFVVDNTNPRSLTNVTASPVVSRTVTNPVWRSRSAAELGARALLNRLSALQATTTITALSNPTRDPGDVVSVSLPAQGGELEVPERHLIESFALSFDGADQTLQTSSGRPTATGDEVVS